MLKGEKIRALIPPLAGVLRLARLVTAGLQSLPHHCWWFPSRVGSWPETKCALANTCVRMRTDCIVGSAVAPPMTSVKGQVGQVSFKKILNFWYQHERYKQVEDDGLQAQVSVGLSYLGSSWWWWSWTWLNPSTGLGWPRSTSHWSPGWVPRVAFLVWGVPPSLAFPPCRPT